MKREDLITLVAILALVCLVWLCLEQRASRRSSDGNALALANALSELRSLRPAATAPAKVFDDPPEAPPYGTYESFA